MDLVYGKFDSTDMKFQELQSMADDVLKPLKEYSLKGTVTIGRSYYVYDGDTIRVATYYNSALYRFNIRLDGFDTPELRSRDDNEKSAGYKARDWLRGILKEKLVWVVCKDADKYGRLLADVYVVEYNEDGETFKPYEECICINKLIVDMGFAVRYNGGTKTDWGLILKTEQYPLRSDLFEHELSVK